MCYTYWHLLTRVLYLQLLTRVLYLLALVDTCAISPLVDTCARWGRVSASLGLDVTSAGGSLQHPAQPPGDGCKEITEQGRSSALSRGAPTDFSQMLWPVLVSVLTLLMFCLMFTCLGTASKLRIFLYAENKRVGEWAWPHDPLYLYQNILRRRLIETLGQPHRPG